MSENDVKFYTEDQLRQYEFVKSFTETYGELLSNLDSLSRRFASSKKELSEADLNYSKNKSKLAADIQKLNSYLVSDEFDINLLPENIKSKLRNKEITAESLSKNGIAENILKDINSQCLMDSETVKAISKRKADALQAVRNTRNNEILDENTEFEKIIQEKDNLKARKNAERIQEIKRLSDICNYVRDPKHDEIFQNNISECRSPLYSKVSLEYKEIIMDSDDSPTSSVKGFALPETLEELNIKMQFIESAISKITDADSICTQQIKQLSKEYNDIILNQRELKKLEPDPTKRSAEVTRMIELVHMKLAQIDNNRNKLEEEHNQNKLNLKFLELAKDIIQDLLDQKFLELNKRKAQEDLEALQNNQDKSIEESEAKLWKKHDKKLNEIMTKQEASEKQIELEFNEMLLPYKSSLGQLIKLKSMFEKIIGSWNSILGKAETIELMKKNYNNLKQQLLKELEKEKVSALLRMAKYEKHAKSADDDETITKINELKLELEKAYDNQIAAIKL